MTHGDVYVKEEEEEAAKSVKLSTTKTLSK
jgi:hypothetical protein